MALSLTNFSAWQKESDRLREVREWLAHIGKKGRSTSRSVDILQISPAHCTAPKFTVAGQYVEAGNNYWESPGAFNEAMKSVILRRFKDLSTEAVKMLDEQLAAALIKAEGEVEAIQAEITEAKEIALRVLPDAAE